jgi:hypothetical protein
MGVISLYRFLMLQRGKNTDIIAVSEEKRIRIRDVIKLLAEIAAIVGLVDYIRQCLAG